jgi:glycosyltransferase involved in cell wall biosynthesis
MDRDPDVTVVLPTFRRPLALRAALASLAVQQPPDATWEVLIVDNDDPPGVADVVAEMERELPVPLRYVRSPVRGACHARNTGISEARGAVVAFCDDDVAPERAWLRSLLQPVLSGEYDGSAGRVELDWDGNRPVWLAPGLEPCLAAYSPHATKTPLGPMEYVLTANAAFRTEVLRSIGGLDPVLGPRAAQPIVNDDIDLYRRYIATGARVCYVPDAVVVHELPEHRLRKRYFLKRTHAQGRSDFRLERDYFLHSSSRGLKSALIDLFRCLGMRWRAGVLRRDVAFNVLCDFARFLGFVRESLASLSPDWEGHAPSPSSPLKAAPRNGSG